MAECVDLGRALGIIIYLVGDVLTLMLDLKTTANLKTRSPAQQLEAEKLKTLKQTENRTVHQSSFRADLF